jgi:hypothetical protein
MLFYSVLCARLVGFLIKFDHFEVLKIREKSKGSSLTGALLLVN